MKEKEVEKLARLILTNRESVLAEWREKVRHLPSARGVETPVLNDHVPALLDELASSLVVNAPDEASDQAAQQVGPRIHGVQRFEIGFNIGEVVAEYSLLREVIKAFAADHKLGLRGTGAQTVDRVIDTAISLAVQTFSDHKTVELQRRREEHFSFVVHDLKTPLTALNTAAKILNEKMPTAGRSDVTETMLDMILRNAARLNALISTAIQEGTNLEAPQWLRLERRYVDLWPIVQSLLDDLRPLADEAYTKLANTVPGHLTVFADASLLTQVLQNLLSNAINYTTHGQVNVGARVVQNGQAVECWVSDTGTGIPEERLGKIFEKLETDPSRKGGLGLGLAIVKQVIEAHGGEIKVESKVGEGSIFRFVLPTPERTDNTKQIPA
ncbi:MAG TPA: HAMP domain-containing sensor histidine kinase [Terriglobia bacterium]|nr:HAMP domain-containing sensor histidine kinase [Terriglobia bacterium]